MPHAAPTSAASPQGPERGTGLPTEGHGPVASPSWLASFLPHPYAIPSVVRAMVWHAEHDVATCANLGLGAAEADAEAEALAPSSSSPSGEGAEAMGRRVGSSRS